MQNVLDKYKNDKPITKSELQWFAYAAKWTGKNYILLRAGIKPYSYEVYDVRNNCIRVLGIFDPNLDGVENINELRQ